MKWIPKDDWHAVSECGLYSVCRVMMPDYDGIDPAAPDCTPLQPWWEAWTVGNRSRQAECLAVKQRFQHEAMEICVSHAGMTHRSQVLG